MTYFTVDADQAWLLHSIRQLHMNGRQFHVDLTYSKGVFYKKDDTEPVVRMDLVNVKPSKGLAAVNLIADCRSLPFCPGSINSMIFDPPFMHATGKDSVLGGRFGSYRSQKELFKLYCRSLDEAYDALVVTGVLVFKCQDTVESAKQVWNARKIANYAESIGFFQIDMAVLINSGNVLIGHNHGIQQNLRRKHCYFMVFRK